MPSLLKPVQFSTRMCSIVPSSSRPTSPLFSQTQSRMWMFLRKLSAPDPTKLDARPEPMMFVAPVVHFVSSIRMSSMATFDGVFCVPYICV